MRTIKQVGSSRVKRIVFTLLVLCCLSFSVTSVFAASSKATAKKKIVAVEKSQLKKIKAFAKKNNYKVVKTKYQKSLSTVSGVSYYRTMSVHLYNKKSKAYLVASFENIYKVKSKKMYAFYYLDVYKNKYTKNGCVYDDIYDVYKNLTKDIKRCSTKSGFKKYLLEKDPPLEPED